MDKETKIQQMKDLLMKFREDRGWGKFHDPKNLAEAISIEASELQEHFLWKTSDESVEKLKNDKKFREEVGEELADVIMYCLNFANSTEIDVATIIKDKIEKNAKKYTIDKSHGNAKKYNQL